ncbi:MAG: HEAT repeat domain-containing protein [Pirellulaceae bacterium]
MDGRNGLVTLAAYLMATLLIVVASLLGIFQYSISGRTSALPAITTESAPELVVAHLGHAAASNPPDTMAARAEQQRIRLLESLLDEKTQRLRQQSEQLKSKTTEYEDLRARYDEAVLLAFETLGRGSDTKTVPENPSDAESSLAKPDPGALEAELTAADVVHESLVSELAALQDELARAYRDLAQLKEARSQETAERLHDALILDSAAHALQRIGRNSVPALREALNHSSPMVRRWAATVLGGIGSDAEEAIPTLTETLSDREPTVRDAARTALEAIER